MRRRLSSTWVMLVAVMGTGCAGPASDLMPAPHGPARSCCVPGQHPAWREAVVRTAAGLVGAHTIEVDGRRIAYDCAGVTRAIFLPHGLDLYRSTTVSRQANGVRLIYNHVRQFGRIHEGPNVQPGDLVFFHNTWDANGDGKLNDPLTHVGVVERVGEEGTVVFISRVAGAIERYRMNLAHPHERSAGDGRVINDYLRRKKGRDNERTTYLTAELFAAFGTPALR